MINVINFGAFLCFSDLGNVFYLFSVVFVVLRGFMVHWGVLEEWLLVYHFSELGSKSSIYCFQEDDFVHFIDQATLLRHFGNDTWGQIEVNRVYYFVSHLVVGERFHEGLGKLLAVSFGPSVVLYLNVEVLATFRAEELGASVVGADESSIDFASCPSKMLLSLCCLHSRAHCWMGALFVICLW